MQMQKRLGWIFALGTTLVAGAWAAGFFGSAEADQPQLLTAAVTRGSVVLSVDATGTLEPIDAVEVGTQVSGTIKTLGADFNARVRKGQVIATLDPAVFESQVEQARASLARLRAELDRAKAQAADSAQQLRRSEELAARHLIPQSELDTARTALTVNDTAVAAAQASLAQAEASLGQAQANRSNTIIRAPVDGVVLSRDVDVGQTVAAGLQAPTLFVIARDLTTMRVSARVNEADIGRVQMGQLVRFSVDAFVGEEFEGRVSQVRLQPTVVQNVVTYTVLIDVPNREQKLKPGMTAVVRIEVERADDTLRVPSAALGVKLPAEVLDSHRAPVSDETSGDTSKHAGSRRGATIWKLENGQLEPIRVNPGLSDGTMVAVTSDALTAGSQVVVGSASTNRVSQTPTSSGSPLVPSFPRRGANGGRAR